MIVRKLTTLVLCIFLTVKLLDGFPHKKDLELELQRVITTGNQSEFLLSLSEDYGLHRIISNEFSTISWPESKINLFCNTCAVTATLALQANSSQAVIDNAIRICLSFGLGNDVVCDGLVNENAPAVIYMAQNYELNGKDICGFIFEDDGCTTDNPDRIWTVTLPNVDKPALIAEPPYPLPSTVPTFKILHISDTHVDPLYLPGSEAVCEEDYFCCRAESTPIENATTVPAGFWGEYNNCDIPVWTIEAMYQHISEEHTDIDFIIWTGDVIPHIVWDTNKNSTLEILKNMTDLLLKYFPDTPVYPALGNHDSDIVNQFSQPYIDEVEFNMAWLYEPLVDIWGDWLPLITHESVAYSASYNLLVKPGLRLISVNTNFCQSINWWSLIDSNDGAEELFKLAQTLQAAEFAGEKVYIIQHIAPGSCFDVYSHQYNLIIARYEATIVGIFYGHSHSDHFKLFFDPEDSERPIEIGYIAGSQTTYTNLNPGYKIYTVEGEFEGSNFRVLDHEGYYLPLDEANANNVTEFKFLYSAKDDYQLPDLSPQSLLDFVYEMNTPDSQLFIDFHRNYEKAGPDSDNCDDSCKHSMLCGLLRSDSSVTDPCRLD